MSKIVYLFHDKLGPRLISFHLNKREDNCVTTKARQNGALPLNNVNINCQEGLETRTRVVFR